MRYRAMAMTAAPVTPGLTETLVYVAGSWGISPADLSLYRHGSVATGAVAVALVFGLPLIAVGRRQDGISASSSGPSSLSSSGTFGSTVWK